MGQLSPSPGGTAPSLRGLTLARLPLMQHCLPSAASPPTCPGEDESCLTLFLRISAPGTGMVDPAGSRPLGCSRAEGQLTPRRRGGPCQPARGIQATSQRGQGPGWLPPCGVLGLCRCVPPHPQSWPAGVHHVVIASYQPRPRPANVGSTQRGPCGTQVGWSVQPQTSRTGGSCGPGVGPWPLRRQWTPRCRPREGTGHVSETVGAGSGLARAPRLGCWAPWGDVSPDVRAACGSLGSHPQEGETVDALGWWLLPGGCILRANAVSQGARRPGCDHPPCQPTGHRVRLLCFQCDWPFTWSIKPWRHPGMSCTSCVRGGSVFPRRTPACPVSSEVLSGAMQKPECRVLVTELPGPVPRACGLCGVYRLETTRGCCPSPSPLCRSLGVGPTPTGCP